MKHAGCLKVIIVLETFYLVKMRHSSRNSNVRELNEKKLVDKIITYCFIEWHNMM